MGYEITYFYHERLPDGKYNVDEKKELKKKVGSPLEEIALEQLAAVVTSQLARRDIWVVDVELFEYTRKKISFKESPDGSGIVIKNKKFGLDKSGVQLIATDIEDPDNDEVPKQHMLGVLPNNQMATRASNLGKIKTWMIFDPEIPQLHEARQKGLKFTVSKRYPIYLIEPHPTLPGQQMFTTVDDNGTTKMIRDEFFVPGVVRLVGDTEVDFMEHKAQAQTDARLTYGSSVPDEPEMPVLR